MLLNIYGNTILLMSLVTTYTSGRKEQKYVYLNSYLQGIMLKIQTADCYAVAGIQ